MAAVGPAATSNAAPGELDPTFGLRATGLVHGPSSANDVAVQSDGKLVAAGLDTAKGGGFSVVRYQPNGSLDPTFAGDGIDSQRFPRGEAHAVAIQSDGKIVVAGTGGQDASPTVVRYNADGGLDTSFSGDGKLVLSSLNGSGAADVAVQPDGKIVLVGTWGGMGYSMGLGVLRLNSDGSLDTSFSSDGVDVPSLPTSSYGRGVMLQSDGRIVAVGRAGANFATVRYNTDGSLDPTFAGDGKQLTAVSNGDGEYAAAVQSDGKIVAVGPGGSASDSLTVVRYTSGGELDTAFSGDGIATQDSFGSAKAVAVQSDGKILVGGAGASADFALIRFTPAGVLDTGFSGDGAQTVDFGAFGTGALHALALQADGRIVAAGSSGQGSGADFALARLNDDGTMDSTFGSSGKVRTNFQGFDASNAVAIQPDGKIVAAGVAGESSQGRDLVLVRYNADLTLDASFGGGGLKVEANGGAAEGLALQPDGKIVVITSRQTVERFNADGTVDTSFSGDGRQDVPLALDAVAIQADGSIVLAGYDGQFEFAVARLTSNGTLDTSFAGDGIQSTVFGSNTDGEAKALAIQPDGKIVAGGSAGFFTNGFAVARYLSDGSLDLTFSGDGKQALTILPQLPGSSGSYPAIASALTVQSDGKVVVAGSTEANSRAGDAVVVRFTAGGDLDATFASGGIADVRVSELGVFVSGVAVDARGAIVLSGYDGLFDDATTHVSLVRFTSGGSLDAGFGTGGIVSRQFYGSAEARAVAVDGNDTIVVAGTIQTPVSNDLLVARFQGGVGSPPTDTDPPTISISKPSEGEHFTLDQAVTASSSCSDGTGSGVATCEGPTTVDTSTAGAHTYTVTATDNAGNPSTKTVHYVVDPQPPVATPTPTPTVVVTTPTQTPVATPSGPTTTAVPTSTPVPVPTPGPTGVTSSLTAGVLTLTKFVVKPTKTGVCPKSAGLVVTAGKAKLTKKVKMSKDASGACVVTATVTLKGALAKATKVKVSIGGRGLKMAKWLVVVSP